MDFRSDPFRFETIASALLAAALVLPAAGGALRWWTASTRPDRRDAIDSALLRPRSLVEDASRILPALASRDFEIRAALEDRVPETTAVVRSLLDAMEHGGGLPGEVDTDHILDAADLCFVRREERHRRLEEWLVDQVEGEPEDDSPAAALYGEIETNYYETAHQAEATGQPEAAAGLYQRYLSLARRLLARGVLPDTLETQRRLSRAQNRVNTLGPLHAFRTEALEDLWHDPASSFDHLEDPDPGIRSLALVTAAGEFYRSGAFADAIDLVEDRADSCGALAAECEFLLAKASFQRALRLAPPHARSALAAAGARFSRLASRLPARHYLKDDALLWLAMVAYESGDRALALRRLAEVPRICPDTDRRSLVEDLLEEYAH